MPAPTALPTKTEARKVLGRGKFTIREAAEAFEVTAQTARKRIAALVEAGTVEVLDETRKNLNADGEAIQGRPAAVYRVTSGK